MSPLIIGILIVVALLIIIGIFAWSSASKTADASTAASAVAPTFKRADDANYIYGAPVAVVKRLDDTTSADLCEKAAIAAIKDGSYPDLKAWVWVDDGSTWQKRCYGTTSVGNHAAQKGYISGYMTAA